MERGKINNDELQRKLKRIMDQRMGFSEAESDRFNEKNQEQLRKMLTLCMERRLDEARSFLKTIENDKNCMYPYPETCRAFLYAADKENYKIENAISIIDITRFFFPYQKAMRGLLFYLHGDYKRASRYFMSQSGVTVH